MKAGFVVRVRVNPADCLSVLDTMQSAGVPITEMSFSGLVSLTLSSLLASMRKSGALPDRSGFEYNQMMAPFLGTKSTQDKRAVTERLYQDAAKGLVPVEIQFPAPPATGGEIVEKPLPEWDTEELVGEFHRLKKFEKSHNLRERERYEQVQAELDKRNTEGL